jgi:hypothetical protein
LPKLSRKYSSKRGLHLRMENRHSEFQIPRLLLTTACANSFAVTPPVLSIAYRLSAILTGVHTASFLTLTRCWSLRTILFPRPSTKPSSVIFRKCRTGQLPYDTLASRSVGARKDSGRTRRRETPGRAKIRNNPLLLRIGQEIRMCCNFVVEPKIGVDDRKLSSSQRTDRE